MRPVKRAEATATGMELVATVTGTGAMATCPSASIATQRAV